MESVQRVNLYVTYVEKEGPFLKLWGQTDKTNAIYVEQFLKGVAPQFDLGVGKVLPENIPPSTLICAKYKDSKYYRAKILNNTFVREGFLEVNFIDYGNKEIVPSTAVRTLQNFLSTVANIPPLAIGFVFAEAHCVGGGEWNDTIFESIAKEIRYREVQCTLLAQATQYYLVRISVEGSDLCSLLIQRGLMQPISLQAQQAVLLSMSMQKPYVPQGHQQPPTSSGINTYKACSLEPGCHYPVYVSYVNDGPCHFSVQLKQTEDVLVILMNDINSINLRPLEDVPIPGTICLARCQEDGNICRAVVTNEVDTQFKVFYVDFGNYEVLPLDSLYQIPFKYVLPKVMAIRFSMAGIEKPSVTVEMQIAFKKFVDNRLLHMKVLPSPIRTALPKCELWDPETKISALDVVIRSARHSYPEPVTLTRGFSQPVKVSFVYSCNRFFVQLVNKEAELSYLMENLQEICKTSEFMEPSYIKRGIPCCALFSSDQLWYRSQILEIIGDNVKVRYIDYGNEEIMQTSQLKTIDGEILTLLRPQAIECCLNGYQKMEPDEERDGLLEEIILEGVFTMKVVDICDKKALVELFDSSNYNVASLLLDKLAAAKSQVSPVLVVQAGNKIEHRKSYSKQKEVNFTGDKNQNTGRDHKGWDKPNEPNERNEKSWRQDNRESRNYDKNTNENNERHWRQNNKGFSPKSRIEKQQENTWNNPENTANGNNTQKVVSDDNWSDTSNTNSTKTQGAWNTQKDDRRLNKRNEYKNNREGFNDKGKGRFNDERERGEFKNDQRGFDNSRGERGNKFGGKPRDAGFKQKDFKNPKSRIEKQQENTWNNPENTANGNNTQKVVSDDNWSDTSNTNSTKTQGAWNTQKDDRRLNKRNEYKNNREGFNDKGKGRFNDERERGEFKNDQRGFDNSRGERGNKFGGKPRDAGFKQKDFKKDSSEMSSSGSEKSFHRGLRTSSRADRGGKSGRNVDKSSFLQNNSGASGDAWTNKASREDSWNVSAVTSIDAAPADTTFVQYEVIGTEVDIAISWFHNPGLFYCQQLDYQDQFKNMMEEIHDFYKDKKPEKVVKGAPIIGLFAEDNVLYRARVLDVIGTEYKIQYIDFGNVSTVSKVWPIEKKFMNLPAQAVACSLNNIAPIGDQWMDPDVYRSYFDKDSFVCKFVNKDEEKCFVNVFKNSDDVAQLLIRDGLAVSTASTVPSIEIPILLGQQFKAIVKSVNNLSDIILALECGLAINCTMHNLDTATETFEETLKDLLEKTVIVFVDNILEDSRLEITLYDTEGNKHVIVNPDEDSYETVDLPCPMLILRSEITGYVSFADETSVFIQPSEYADQISFLVDQLFEVYDGKTNENPIIPEEGSIYAVHSEDGNWYRGRVISFDDEAVSVFYMDYGNIECVAFGKLKELDSQFIDIYLLSVQVTVPSDASSFIDKEVAANVYYGETGWQGTLQVLDTAASALPQGNSAESTDTGFATSSIIKPDEDESVEKDKEESVEVVDEPEIMEESGIVETDTAISETEKKFINEEDALTNGTAVFVSHIDTPSDFYIQFSENMEDIERLQTELQENVVEMEVLENPVPGVLCAAPYSADQKWCRAEVLDADEDITTVRFVDFGNTDVIDNKTTQVKTLPPKLLSLAIYATRCTLQIEPLEEEWNPSALGLFETLAYGKKLKAEFFSQDEKCTYVDLYVDGINIADAMITENLAKPILKSTETKQTGFVSHLNSPSEFWIQLESCIDELQWIDEQLSAAKSFPEIIDLTPGTLCAALFPDDQMWYRARILSNTVAGVELLFIDYGNSCTSADLRQLPEDLIMTAPLAMKCSLQKNEGIPFWSPEAAAKFEEISADGQTIFTVKKISTGETSIVQLILNDNDVTTMLLPSTEDGFVKEIDSLKKLTIENKNGEQIESVALEAMDGQELDVKAEEKFEEINKKGTTLFQIEFINEKSVRLYLDGIDIRPLLGSFKNASFDPCQKGLVNPELDNDGHVEIVDVNNIASSTQIKQIINDEQIESIHTYDDIEEEVDSEQEYNDAIDVVEINETVDYLEENGINLNNTTTSNKDIKNQNEQVEETSTVNAASTEQSEPFEEDNSFSELNETFVESQESSYLQHETFVDSSAVQLMPVTDMEIDTIVKKVLDIYTNIIKEAKNAPADSKRDFTENILDPCIGIVSVTSQEEKLTIENENVSTANSNNLSGNIEDHVTQLEDNTSVEVQRQSDTLVVDEGISSDKNTKEWKEENEISVTSNIDTEDISEFETDQTQTVKGKTAANETKENDKTDIEDISSHISYDELEVPSSVQSTKEISKDLDPEQSNVTNDKNSRNDEISHEESATEIACSHPEENCLSELKEDLSLDNTNQTPKKTTEETVTTNDQNKHPVTLDADSNQTTVIEEEEENKIINNEDKKNTSPPKTKISPKSKLNATKMCETKKTTSVKTLKNNKKDNLTTQALKTEKPLLQRTSLCLPKDLSSKKDEISLKKEKNKSSSVKTSPPKINLKLSPTKTLIKTDSSVSQHKSEKKLNPKKPPSESEATVSSIKTDSKLSPNKTSPVKRESSSNFKSKSTSPIKNKVASKTIVGDVLNDIVAIASSKDEHQPQESCDYASIDEREK